MVMEVFRGPFREHMAFMESRIGLYEAIARLPERQFDVVLLHYILGYDFGKTAKLMGIRQATVRSLCRHAKERLALDLGLSVE
ncbi:sigma-70 family RNA polymerase sigma factor [Streptomyces puniciscabiei]|nr:sigma-70 family RNA polymerase sigma factor [Streptomyces puniciscabiei]